MNEQVLENYEINEKTMAVLSAAHTDYYSIILEGSRKLYVKKTPMELIKTACLEGGAGYNGRRASVTYRTGIQRKVPIPINEVKNIYAFPTQSPSQFGCHWIFPSHIRNLAIDPYTKNGCLVIFKNNKIISIDVSIKSMEKQIHRTSHCVCVFSNQCSSTYAADFLL